MSSPGVSYNNHHQTLQDGGLTTYVEFLKRKAAIANTKGITVDASEVNPILKPHQIAMVVWALRGGCRALFASFGLGKTVVQLEIVRLVLKYNTGRGLIVAPLGVRQEFIRDARMLGIELTFIRTIEEAGETGIYITNYESVRDGKLDPKDFVVVTLDEGSCLRSFGSKTFSEMLFGSAQTVPFRFVATATPSPNEFQELLAYAHFLGIMDIGQSRTRFFKRNSEKSDNLTLHTHKEREFWLWVSSWALFVEKPSDLGYSDEGYDLPEMIVRWHEVRPLAEYAGTEKSGQHRLYRDAAVGMVEAAREKKDSLGIRIGKMLELLNDSPDDHCILWHDLEAERAAIEKAVPSVQTVYGSQDLEAQEKTIAAFSNGECQYIGAKPVMLGSGTNLQRYCHRAIFLGIGFKFNDFIQAIHRIQRFLQQHTVYIDLIYTEGEREIRKNLERKWKQHNQMRERMREIIREFGLSDVALASALTRALGVERQEVKGKDFRLVHNDSVIETRSIPTDSVHLGLTSIPFASQYEYSPNYADFGHTDDNPHFFEQMDFLTPECFRILVPGRDFVVHVKDRVVPSAMTGLGFQVVYPFHCDVIAHYQKHGFAFMGMKTIVTDVVRENNQTYRLGWTEQCKDGTKMGYGLPEYLLVFRKPCTDTSNSYGDVPVVKSKEQYTRSRWQIDAHGFMRSNGDRLLAPEEWQGLKYNEIYQLYKRHSLESVYDYQYHVKVGEALDQVHKLPVDFMLLPPQSWHRDVWTDVTKMRTLNTAQSSKGREKHLCPMQFDVANRIIEQLSMPGETVFDPFAGLGTVPYCALKLGRKAIGIELAAPYFNDSISYCKAAEAKANMPSLFDMIEQEQTS
jgi:DNA modification methylase